MFSQEPGTDTGATEAIEVILVVRDFSWYLPLFNPKYSQPNILLEHLATRATTSLPKSRRILLTKYVTTEKKRTFDLRVEKNNVPISL